MNEGPATTYSVGLIAPEFPPDIGGVETYSFELAAALAAIGHRVTVFTVPHAGGETTVPGVSVSPVLRYRRRLDRQLIDQYPVDVWHAANASYAWIASETPNLVVSVHGNDFLLPYSEVARPDLDRLPSLWRIKGRARQWLSAADRAIGRWRSRRWLADNLPRVPCVVTNSKYTESALLEMFPGCRGRTSVGLVGVGEEFLRLSRAARPADDPVRLLTVCRLSEPRKNVDLVLRAIAGLKDRFRFSYTLIGDGPTRSSLEGLAEELGLGGVVRFSGRVPQGVLMKELSSADLFVLTSSKLPASHEGFGIAYLEANAAGTPVLAARLAGAIEAVDEGVSGMFVEEPTVPQIRAAIESFLSGQVTFDSDRCREFASRFTWRRVAEHFTACYARVAKPR